MTGDSKIVFVWLCLTVYVSMEFHTKWDGASYDVGHALSHQVGQLFTASALFTIN